MDQRWSKRRETVQRALDSLLASGKGTPVTWSGEQQRLARAIAGWSDDETVQSGHIVWAIGQMAERGLRGVDALEQLLDSLQPQVTGASDQPRWVFGLPLHAPVVCAPSAAPSIRVFGLDVHLMNLGADGNLLESEARACTQMFGLFAGACCDGPILVGRVSGQSGDAAWAALAGSIELIRAVMEFSRQLGMMRFSLGPEVARPRQDLPSPRVLLYLRPDGLLDAHPLPALGEQADRPRQEDLPPPVPHDWASVAAMLKPFAKPVSDGSTKSLIADALRLYALAMGQPMPHQALLNLWQLAEAVALIGRKDSATTVCERCATFGSVLGSTGGELTSGVMTDLMRKRNQVVHRGYHHLVRDADVQVLKWICESAILWLIEHQDKLPTREHLRHFYTYRTLPPVQLDRMAEVIGIVRGARQAPS